MNNFVIPSVLVLVLLATSAHATLPLVDRLELEGETTDVFPAACCWLQLPASAKLQEMRRAERCSAIGGPVGRWRVADSKLWLVGFRRCGANIPLEEVFGGTGEPLLADWMSGQIKTHRGRPLCYGGMAQFPVYEFTLTLTVDRGHVSSIERASNASDPRVPREMPEKGIPFCLWPEQKAR